MAQLKGAKTHTNLKEAFAGESQANRRYLYFARQADIEGYPDVGGLFRDTAEAETGHGFGHLDYLKQAGDPATDKPIGSTSKNLAAAVAGETYEYTEMYPGMAKTARGRVRAVELAPDRVLVEAVPPAPPFAELPDDLARELLSLAREISTDWRSKGRAPELAIDAAGPHARIEVRARA